MSFLRLQITAEREDREERIEVPRPRGDPSPDVPERVGLLQGGLGPSGCAFGHLVHFVTLSVSPLALWLFLCSLCSVVDLPCCLMH